MNFRRRSIKVWEQLNPENNENAKLLLDAVLDNSREANRAYKRSYYLSLVFSSIYWALFIGKVTELDFFSITITDIDLVKWVLPTLASFTFYQGICHFLTENFLQRFVEKYMENHLKIMVDNDLEGLIYCPSFLNYERFLANNIRTSANINKVIATIILIGWLIVPFFIIVYILYINVKTAGGLKALGSMEYVLSFVTIIFIVRIPILIISSLREVGDS